MTRELSPTGCQTRVYGDRDVFGYQCQKKPTVTRDGKLYCTIHDPEYRNQKDTARRERWDKEGAENHKQWLLKVARRRATEGLTLIELERVTPDLIRQALAKVQTQ